MSRKWNVEEKMRIDLKGLRGGVMVKCAINDLSCQPDQEAFVAINAMELTFWSARRRCLVRHSCRA